MSIWTKISEKCFKHLVQSTPRESAFGNYKPHSPSRTQVYTSAFFNIQVSCMMTLTHSHTQADALGVIWRSVSCPTSRMEKTGGQFNFLQWATTAAPVHHIVYLVEFLVTHVVYPEIIPVPKVIMSLFEQLLYNMLFFDSNIFLMVLWLCFAYIVIEITFQYVHCLQYIFTTLRFILIMTCMQIIFTPIRRSWQ